MKQAFILLRFTAGVLAFGAIAWRVDLHAARTALSNASPTWIAAAFVANLCAVVLSATLWRVTISTQRPSVFDAWRMYIVGVFFNNVGLGTSIGDAFRAQSLHRRGHSPATAIASVGTERVASVGALLVLASAGAVPLFPQQRLLAGGVWLGSGSIVLGVAMLVAITPHIAGIQRLPRGATILVTDMFDAVLEVLRRPRVVLTACALALSVQLCTVTATVMLARAVNVHVSPVEALTVVPIIALAVLTPISVQGIGVRETAYVGLFGVIGVASEAALAIALLSYVTTLLVSLVGGATFVSEFVVSRRATERRLQSVHIDPATRRAA